MDICIQQGHQILCTREAHIKFQILRQNHKTPQIFFYDYGKTISIYNDQNLKQQNLLPKAYLYLNVLHSN